MTLPTTDIRRAVPEDGLLKVGAKSDPKAVASAIVKSIFDSQIFPTLRSVGHMAAGQACKSIAIARGYLAVRAIDLAVTIGFENVPNDEGDDEMSAQVFHTFKR